MANARHAVAGAWRHLAIGRGTGPGHPVVRVYDVGQGQLVELRTARYRALVDTGPRFGSGFMPLETLWAPGQAFDDVIVSHGDQDHAGGLAALSAEHDVERYLAPPGEALPVAASSCRAGRVWRRDGVEFRFLWPPPRVEGLSANDRSCVLLVTAGAHRLLIPGDVAAGWREASCRCCRDRSKCWWRGIMQPYQFRAVAGGQTLARCGHLQRGTRQSLRAPRRRGGAPFSTSGDLSVEHRPGWCIDLTLGGRDDPRIAAARSLSWRPGGVGQDCLALESPAIMPGLPVPSSTEAETP